MDEFRALIWNAEFNEDPGSSNDTPSLLRSITIMIDAVQDPAPFDENHLTKTEIDDADVPDANRSQFDGHEKKIKVQIPPVWMPLDGRANAALIYLYFRSVIHIRIRRYHSHVRFIF